MNWKTKASIMSVCSKIIYGDKLYVQLQKVFGRLDTSPHKRLTLFYKLAKILSDESFNINKKVILELGTGHKPVLPVCFFLCGSRKIYTVDLNERIDYKILKSLLEKIYQNREEFITNTKDYVPIETLKERFKILFKYIHDPKSFLENANIHYLSPVDARKINLPENSIDLYESATVLEHIEEEILNDILKEANRLLKKGGLCIHIIDLSDHFQHQDRTISKINFLKYSDNEWSNIAGNQFAYCNRLRCRDYLSFFNALPWDNIKIEKKVDEGSLHALKNGFKLDPKYVKQEHKDLCTTHLEVVATK